MSVWLGIEPCLMFVVAIDARDFKFLYCPHFCLLCLGFPKNFSLGRVYALFFFFSFQFHFVWFQVYSLV